MSPPNERRRPARTAPESNTTGTQTKRSHRFSEASETRRAALGVSKVDKAIECAQGRCNCTCREDLEEIIARHGGPGEAA